MIENKKIIFESGRILNSKMLNELQNFSLRNIEIKSQERYIKMTLKYLRTY